MNDLLMPFLTVLFLLLALIAVNIRTHYDKIIAHYRSITAFHERMKRRRDK